MARLISQFELLLNNIDTSHKYSVKITHKFKQSPKCKIKRNDNVVLTLDISFLDDAINKNMLKNKARSIINEMNYPMSVGFRNNISLEIKMYNEKSTENGLAIDNYIMIPIINIFSNNETQTIYITQDNFKCFGFSSYIEAFECGYYNFIETLNPHITRNPRKRDGFDDTITIDEEFENLSNANLYMITNNQHTAGASMIVCSDIIEQLSDKLKTSLYAIPFKDRLYIVPVVKENEKRIKNMLNFLKSQNEKCQPPTT